MDNKLDKGFIQDPNSFKNNRPAWVGFSMFKNSKPPKETSPPQGQSLSKITIPPKPPKQQKAPRPPKRPIKALSQKPDLTKNDFIKYGAAAAVIICCCSALVLGLNPFGAGLFAAFVMAGLSPLVLAPIYILPTLLFSFSISSLIGTLSYSLILILFYLIKSKKNLSPLLFLPVTAAAQLAFLPFAPHYSAAPVVLLITLSPLAAYVGYCFFLPLFKNGVRFKLLDTELICGGIVLCIVAMGLNRAAIFHFPTVAVFAAFAILFAALLYGPTGGLVVSICFGIGAAAYTYQISDLAVYAAMGLLAAVFRGAPRLIGASANILGFVLVTFFFGLDMQQAHLFCLALLIGGVSFCIIPKGKLAKLKNILNPDKTQASARFSANLLREEAGRRLFKTGEAFAQMSFFISQEQEKSDFNPYDYLPKIKNKICQGCYKNCNQTTHFDLLTKEELESEYKKIVPLSSQNIGIKSTPLLSALNKDASCTAKSTARISKSTVSTPCLINDQDICSLLLSCFKNPFGAAFQIDDKILSNCIRYADIVALGGEIAKNHRSLAQKNKHEQEAKKIIFDQLDGISQVLKGMAKKINSPLSFNF
ncbi:MAG: hypothetical protein FWD86_02855, partial [Firmicutes bacterium]|nr:hypothetical protein [Bacillota bacterium]